MPSYNYNYTNIIELKPNSITLSGSKLVADRFEAKFHYRYATWFEAGSKLVADLSLTC